MSNLSLISSIQEVNGRLVTSSRQVGSIFGVEHKNVLQTLQTFNCSDEFRRLNFQPSDYLNSQGKFQPEVLLTRNGVMALVKKYNDPEAWVLKEAYMAAFDAMESRQRPSTQVSQLTIMQNMVQYLLESEAANKANAAAIVELSTTKADAANQGLSTDHIIALNDAIDARCKECGFSRLYRKQIYSDLKHRFLKGQLASSVTYKDIKQQDLPSALNIVEHFVFY